MYFSGGIIPTYILIRQLGLIDNFLVYIIPPLIALWNVMIMRTFFEDVPASLLDSARIDGCGELRIFYRIVLPLSKPVLACIALFIGVDQWNSWYDTYLYTSSGWLMTLQGILVQVLWERQSTMLVDAATLSEKAQQQQLPRATPQTVQMAIIVITTVPIALIYPFVQKYFVKGVMIGAIKG
jgi:putative aldouronate transport system permease protein